MLSIVIASHNSGGALGDCLSALHRQQGIESCEILVAGWWPEGSCRRVEGQFPGVRLLEYPEGLNLAQLRGKAMARARGDLVAVLDPYCRVEEGWLTELLKLHAQRPEPAIGGAVELDSPQEASPAAWANYFNEYAAFMLPMPEGPAAELTGNNLAYKRPALEDPETLERSGFWKSFYNRRLRSQGHALWAAPSLLVRLRKPVSFWEFFRSRYHHGRCFGAMRVADASPWERWLRAASVPLLPPLALWRLSRTVLPKGRHRVKFLAALPALALYNCAWAWGELWGYLRGPGESCSHLHY